MNLSKQGKDVKFQKNCVSPQVYPIIFNVQQILHSQNVRGCLWASYIS